MDREVSETSPEAGAVEASAELTAVIGRWFRALGARDRETMTALISGSPATRYLGSDEDEIFEGPLVRDGFAQHIAEVPDLRLRTTSLEAFQRGPVGWAVWRGSVRSVEDGDWHPWRYSFVLTLEAGIWKIVHAHSSTPRLNTEVIGRKHVVFHRLMAAAEEQRDAFGVEGTATIMFTDIANSTTLAAFAGDRAWAETIGRHFQAVREIVEAREGVVVKTLGDGTMSSFSSAHAAMIAAREVQRSVADGEDGPELGVRIGLHTGDVLQAEGDFIGSVVNVAARIAAIAEPARAMTGGARDLTFGEPLAVSLRGVEGGQIVSRLVA